MYYLVDVQAQGAKDCPKDQYTCEVLPQDLRRGLTLAEYSHADSLLLYYSQCHLKLLNGAGSPCFLISFRASQYSLSSFSGSTPCVADPPDQSSRSSICFKLTSCNNLKEVLWLFADHHRKSDQRAPDFVGSEPKSGPVYWRVLRRILLCDLACRSKRRYKFGERFIKMI